MDKLLRLLVLAPSILFVFVGVRWLVDPAGAAPMFGLTLEQGVGLSSQVGDMSAFFLTLGSCMLIALISGRRLWYYPPLMLLLAAAVGRLVAWMAHDATFAVSLIGTEILVSALLFLASHRLADKG
ncbi:MAG: hypothetical protein NWR12_05850 [Haliea sp.]|nr:hypothetical protein [Haliea sp.]MDP4788824.1 hypothetical protein [Haliea sp.]MDP4917223.1 hypothetical protein [Haliea sp.]MDP5065536.1 hypothetical protein [Haliea sp.]